MWDDFLLRALLAGAGIAVVAGPLGSFVVWRRMSYFGAALAHAALLGVALGIMLGTSPEIGVLAVCIATAALLVLMRRGRDLGNDTLLGILAHGALALGLVVVSLLETVRVDLMGYLFGDVLAVSATDVVWILGGGAVVLGALAVLWRRLLAITVHEELARVEGVPVAAVEFAFMLLMAVVVALAMKVVGVLLVVSLLIIPAATARRFARTPEQMALLAALAGVLSVGGGLWGSWKMDIPAGPAIVVAATALFALGSVLRVRR